MKPKNTFKMALLSGLAIAALALPASACTNSIWKKIAGNSLADTIEGRDCSGTMSVRMTGVFGDTGWIPMYKNGTADFFAQYGDGQVLTDIHMKVDGVSMTGIFQHRDATGSQTTEGTYVLNGF